MNVMKMCQRNAGRYFALLNLEGNNHKWKEARRCPSWRNAPGNLAVNAL